MDARTHTPQMKQREFVAEEGTRCPYCRSLDVHAAKFRDCEDGKPRRKMRCYECGHAWDEIYRLAGYEGF